MERSASYVVYVLCRIFLNNASLLKLDTVCGAIHPAETERPRRDPPRSSSHGITEAQARAALAVTEWAKLKLGAQSRVAAAAKEARYAGSEELNEEGRRLDRRGFPRRSKLC